MVRKQTGTLVCTSWQTKTAAAALAVIAAVALPQLVHFIGMPGFGFGYAARRDDERH